MQGDVARVRLSNDMTMGVEIERATDSRNRRDDCDIVGLGSNLVGLDGSHGRVIVGLGSNMVGLDGSHGRIMVGLDVGSNLIQHLIDTTGTGEQQEGQGRQRQDQH